MTLAPLSTTPELAWLDAAEAAVDSTTDPNLLPAETARVERMRVARLMARLAARDAALIRRIDDAELAKASGATSTGALIAGDFGGDRAGSSRMVHTAKNLEIASLTERALSDGDLSYEKAEVVSKVIASLPDDLDEMSRLRVEKRLVSDARRLSLPDLRRRVMRVADIYRSREQADLDEDAKLRWREARAWQATELWFGQASDGLVPFGGKLPARSVPSPRRDGTRLCPILWSTPT